MIVGVGSDVVDLARFTQALARPPHFAHRRFTGGERVAPARSPAARFAAKEARAASSRCRVTVD
jgi:holo-[acyl-carrier protein] synthase